jgi:hypothetical protein
MSCVALAQAELDASSSVAKHATDPSGFWQAHALP